MPNFVVDEVVTAAKMNELPKGVLGAAAATATQSGVSSMADITGLSVAVTVASAARRILIIANVNFRQRTSGGTAAVYAFEGSTLLGRVGSQTLTTDAFALATGQVLLTPTSGAHTYKLRANTTAGTVDLVADTGASFGSNTITVIDLGAV